MIQMSLVGLGLALLAGMVIVVLYQSGWSRIRGVLARGTWAMRRRYCWLLCAAPAILGVYAWFNPHMLQALLLVRDTSTLTVFGDIFKMTLISFFTAGVGLALGRLIDLNGDLRFGKISALLSIDEVESSPVVAKLSEPDTQLSWSWRRIYLWWVLGSVFPVFVALTSLQEGNANWLVLIAGALTGASAANAVALFLAGLQRWVLGHIDKTAYAGILPFESCVRGITPWTIGKFKVPGDQFARRLFGERDRGFSWLLEGPGYTDPQTRILLPGQAQAIILAAFSSVVYLFWYYRGLSDTTWRTLDWPSGFFAIQLIFLIGYFMSGLAFWLDRFGLPPTVFAVLYTVTVFYFNVTDHYFEITIPPASTLEFAAIAEGDRANAYVAAASGKPDSYEQLYWADVLQDWPFPVINKKKTLVVVTASGGGIQAAAWTAKVLTELDEKFPGFSQSIGLISAVSGGSVGTMFYLGHRGLIEVADKPVPTRMLLAQPMREAVKHGAEQSSLEAVAWGLAFPDFVRTVVPPAAPRFTDRGWALESWWWNSMGNGLRNRQLMEAVTIRDLIPLTRAHRMPPVVFNATCVETGQRVQISPLHVAVAKAREDHPDDWRPEVETMGTAGEVAQELVSVPIDFLDYFDAALGSQRKNVATSWSGANVRVSTAVRLSATFSYVTPVTRPSPASGFGFAAAFDRIGLWARGEQTDLQRRLNQHFCDGGYADNPGLVTAVHSLRNLMDYYRRSETAPPFDQVLVVRIEPFPQSAAQHAKDNTGFLSAVYGPSAALNAMRVSTQAERGELELQLLEDSHSEITRSIQFFNESLASLRFLEASMPPGTDAQKSIQGIVEAVGLHKSHLSHVVPSKWRRTIVPDSKSLASIAGRLEKIQLPEQYSNSLKHARRHFKSAIDILSKPKSDSFSVPIHSVTFRFETYLSDREGHPKEPNQSADRTKPREEAIEPPLTWTLTQTQIKDLDLAWKRISSEENWSTVNISTADNLAPEGIGKFFEPVKEGQSQSP